MNWLGATISVCASYFCGVTLAKTESERLMAVDSLLKLLSHMKRRISSERLPLYKIFSDFEDDFLESKYFLHLLRSHRQGLEVYWQKAIKTLLLDFELQSELVHFGSSLGTLPLEEQIKRIDAIEIFLSEKREILKDTVHKKQKSIKTICLLVGFTVSIILL